MDGAQPLSTGEQRIFNIAMTCTTDGLAGIKVDYELLAERAGCKPSSAAVLFGNAKRKLLGTSKAGASKASASGDGASNVTKTPTKSRSNKVTKRTPKSTPGKGKNAAAIASALEEDPSPTRKGKGASGIKADPDLKVKSEFEPYSLMDRDGTLSDFSNEMVEGTSYPRTELEWTQFEQSLWHVETYNSEDKSGIIESIEPMDA